MQELGMGKKNNGEKNPSPLDLSSLEGWGATWSKRGTSCPNPLARDGSWSGPDGERTRWKGNNGETCLGIPRLSQKLKLNLQSRPGSKVSTRGLHNRSGHPSPDAIEMYRKCAIHHGPGAWLGNNRVEPILHVRLNCQNAAIFDRLSVGSVMTKNSCLGLGCFGRGVAESDPGLVSGEGNVPSTTSTSSSFQVESALFSTAPVRVSIASRPAHSHCTVGASSSTVVCS
jgi:hypothetical protein